MAVHGDACGGCHERTGTNRYQYPFTHNSEAHAHITKHSSKEEIPTQTFVWTAGASQSLILKELPIRHDSRGALSVDGILTLRAIEMSGHLVTARRCPIPRPEKYVRQ